MLLITTIIYMYPFANSENQAGIKKSQHNFGSLAKSFKWRNNSRPPIMKLTSPNYLEEDQTLGNKMETRGSNDLILTENAKGASNLIWVLSRRKMTKSFLFLLEALAQVSNIYKDRRLFL